ncbi:transcriptional regulator [Streptacidiphilus pinicola]|uniref:Transcriptional regulator n=1 Tax=Streptacidiphilus pinicola TaxID=2219663 RepID=A0A2X0JV41_9ACTN|nr:helix-turn-helix transcriptional regulator [Streptacidiphilus pinicola]RAG80775.1 transcriptional regulator [Streptacidiphilus pinicola]
MDRTALADFLRRSRERLNTADVGLPDGARRRTPGLRREEVASLAGMSVDYYTRLEQRRGPRPSPQLLAALARALRLGDDERDHLFHLSGQQPPQHHHAADHVRPGLLLILDRLWDTPAQVITDLGEVLVQNPMARALWGDFSGRPPADRNLVRLWFLDPTVRALTPAEDHERLGRAHAAHLRAIATARPEDRRAHRLVEELLAGSPEFAAYWAEHDVAQRRSDVKRVLHPLVGLLELSCEVLVRDGGEQRLLVFTTEPGSVSAERMELLRVVGLQDLRAEPDADARLS